MAVTLKDVAQLAGVSRSAVSRTFTDNASVSAKMRQKVEKAARELGYSPNALASSLTTGRTRLIGLVSNNFHNPIFLEVFDLFTRAIQDRGLRPLLVNLSDETDPENSVRMLRQYSVDGVVLASSTLSPEFALAFMDLEVPVVHSFGRKINSPKLDIVGIDNIACGRLAARTLVERGYRKVGHIAGPVTATSAQDRYKGFMEEMEKHPGVAVQTSFAEGYSFDAGRREILRLLDSGPLAEAYFCGDDVLSFGVLSGLRERGLKVPDDVGIIGLNDMKMAAWPVFDLTTIRQPIPEIVETSVERMSARLNDPDQKPGSTVFDCEVIERGTLRPLKT